MRRLPGVLLGSLCLPHQTCLGPHFSRNAENLVSTLALRFSIQQSLWHSCVDFLSGSHLILSKKKKKKKGDRDRIISAGRVESLRIKLPGSALTKARTGAGGREAATSSRKSEHIHQKAVLCIHLAGTHKFIFVLGSCFWIFEI